MSKEIMFGSTGINEVAAPQEGMKIAERQIANINSTKAREPNIFGMIEGGAKVATAYFDTTNVNSANKAKTDYINLIMSKEYRDATPTGRAEIFEGIYKGMSEEQSPAYIEAMKNYSAAEYVNNVDKREVEVDNAHYNSLSALYKTTEGVKPEEFIDAYHSTRPRLDKVVMSTALLQDLYGEMALNISMAQDEQGLQEALVNNEEMKDPYKTPFFLDKKSKQGLDKIAGLDKQLQQVLAAKKEELNNQSYTALSIATVGGFREPLANVEKHIDRTSSNVYTATKAKIEYQKQHEERLVADSYAQYNPIGSRVQALPKDNPLIMKERQEQVTGKLVEHLQNEDYVNFARVAYNEKDFGKKTGEALLNIVNNAKNGEEVKQVVGFLDKVNELPQGPTALRQMLTDDQYVRLQVIGSMSSMYPDKSIVEVKDIIDKSKGATTNVKLDPEASQTILEYGVKLGHNYHKYMNIIDTMKQINPQLALDNYENVANYLDKSVSKDSILKTTIDTSEAGIPETLDPKDFKGRVKDMVLKEDTALAKFTTNNKGETLLITSDDFGIAEIQNVEYLKTASDKHVKEYLVDQSKKPKNLYDYREAAIRTAVDNSADASTFMYSISTVGPRFLTNFLQEVLSSSYFKKEDEE